MRSPAAAILWEFHRRHRWGMTAVAVYLAVLAAIRLFVIGPGRSVDMDDETFGLIVMVPFTSSFFYLVAVFSFGLSGDLAGRESIYPSRMFTLPVTTAALAGWPILYGAVVMVLLWFATRFLALWPRGVELPVVWPALLAAAVLAWIQALMWMPYPLRGLRVIATVGWLVALDAIVFTAFELRASETMMLALLAPNLPLAYATARFALGRARRGEVPDWNAGIRRTGAAVRRLDPFRSPARAQAWFEWRRHGRSLPALVAILVPFELGMLFIFNEVPVIVFEILMLVLLTPPFMAIFVGATVSRSDSAVNPYGVTPFMATRPLSDGALVAAKLRMAVWSTLAAWIVVLVALPLAVGLSMTTPLFAGGFARLTKILGAPRAVAIVLVVLALLVLATWKQLVQSLFIGMSGREWLVKGSAFAALALVAIVLPVAHRVAGSRAAIATLWQALPWILAALVVLKLAAATRVLIRLHGRRLLADRALVLAAACWCAAVFALHGLLAWIVPALLVPSYILALVAILAVPLTRVSAAPLALASSRHGERR